MDEPMLDEPAMDIFDRPPDKELTATIHANVRGHLAKSGRHTLHVDSLMEDRNRDKRKGKEKELKMYQSRRKQGKAPSDDGEFPSGSSSDDGRSEEIYYIESTKSKESPNFETLVPKTDTPYMGMTQPTPQYPELSIDHMFTPRRSSSIEHAEQGHQMIMDYGYAHVAPAAPTVDYSPMVESLASSMGSISLCEGGTRHQPYNGYRSSMGSISFHEGGASYGPTPYGSSYESGYDSCYASGYSPMDQSSYYGRYNAGGYGGGRYSGGGYDRGRYGGGQWVFDR